MLESSFYLVSSVQVALLEPGLFNFIGFKAPQDMLQKMDRCVTWTFIHQDDISEVPNTFDLFSYFSFYLKHLFCCHYLNALWVGEGLNILESSVVLLHNIVQIALEL